MMKKSVLLTALAVITLTLGALAQNKKVAVVTFYINKQIDVTEFGAAAYVAVNKLSDDPEFNVAPLLKSFHSQFFETYSKGFPFELMPEEQVTNNDSYKAFTPTGIATSGVLKASNYIIPVDGYKVILQLAGHENEKNLLKIFSAADGVMDVAIDFKMVKMGFGGMGIVKVVSKATIVLFNKKGDKVFSVEEEGKSKNSSPLIAGVPVMTAEKVMPMCQSAMDELMTTLQKDMPKLVKKADSKL